MAIRDLLPASEASWRIPLVLFTAMGGMAFGSWFAGLAHDHFGYYAPAFGIGVVFNLANLLIIGFLVFRLTGSRRSAFVAGRRSKAAFSGRASLAKGTRESAPVRTTGANPYLSG